MRKISTRTRLTFWYIIMLTVFLYLGVVGSYNAVQNILITQHTTMIQKGASRLSDIMNKDDSDIPTDIQYILFDNHDKAYYGRYQDWMTSIPRQLNQLVIIERDDQYWAFYDALDEKSSGWNRSIFDMTSTMELLKEMRWFGIIMIIPSLIISAIGGIFITRWALGPIRKITKTAKEIGNGDLSKRIELDLAKDEIGELLTEFNKMADNLQKVIEREKQFSSDASHEMRTPISAIIANAEYAIQSQDLTISAQSLQLILDKSQQMQRMLSQLLILARGHEQSDAMELEPLDISNIIEDIAEERQVIASEKQITIHTDLENNTIIDADLMLFTRMITNLINNAIEYGRNGGNITLSVFKEKQTNNAVIIVLDDGIGIAKDQLPFIFDRFFRVDKSRSKAGAGLGLSFVDFIVKLHRSTIVVDSNLDQGTCFKMSFLLSQQQ